MTRFAIERVAAGWSVWDLSQASGVNRSNIDRFENGTTTPTLPTLVGLARILGLRLDWVPAHLVPLLALDEFEVRALVRAAMATYGSREAMVGLGDHQTRKNLIQAMHKLDWDRGVQSGGDETDG